MKFNYSIIHSLTTHQLAYLIIPLFTNTLSLLTWLVTYLLTHLLTQLTNSLTVVRSSLNEIMPLLVFLTH